LIDLSSGRVRDVSHLMDALLGAAERQRLLMGELSHRVKNILAVGGKQASSVKSRTVHQNPRLEDLDRMSDSAFFARRLSDE
jgi:two-component sensor histidine kinase